jgi:hypothetical protein
MMVRGRVPHFSRSLLEVKPFAARAMRHLKSPRVRSEVVEASRAAPVWEESLT